MEEWQVATNVAGVGEDDMVENAATWDTDLFVGMHICLLTCLYSVIRLSCCSVVL